jgi:hypothetical protein
MAIYATFLVVICQMYAATFAALRTYDAPLTERQLAYAAFNHLGQVIRTTPAVIDPTFTTMLVGVYATPPLRYNGFVVRDGGRVLGYRQNGSRLEEISYATDYDPTQPSTCVPSEPARLVCANISLFEVGLYSPDTPTLVQLRLDFQTISLQTLVNFREAQ